MNMSPTLDHKICAVTTPERAKKRGLPSEGWMVYAIVPNKARAVDWLKTDVLIDNLCRSLDACVGAEAGPSFRPWAITERTTLNIGLPIDEFIILIVLPFEDDDERWIPVSMLLDMSNDGEIQLI